ncbi:hypothetical protein L6R29_02960 [Myxococcota bacterium]|nr:hypothetical protein [Myxococcota bacterium]
MKPLSPDTDPKMHAFLVEGYRAMTPQQKWKRLCDLNRTVRQMALVRIRQQHPQASENEQQLRLAALWLPADLMRQVFQWDLQQQGY